MGSPGPSVWDWTNKTTKLNLKKVQTYKNIRIDSDTQKKIKKILASANQKKFGRKVRADQVLNLALDLLTDEDIKRLQNFSMSNEDRKELLRQKYIATIGAISKDEFTGFMMSSAFLDFIKVNEANIQSA